MATYRNDNRNEWRPGDNADDRDRDRMDASRGDRGEMDSRYSQRFSGADDRGRYGWRPDDDRGRFGYGGASSRGQQDGDRLRDDRPRYSGQGGQSGSQAGFGRDEIYGGREMYGGREGREMFGREGYGHQDTGYGGRGYGMDGRLGEGFSGRERSGYQGSQGYSQGDQGQAMPGGHRGKGPQGYQRSDERIREEVCQVLTDDDHIDASAIDITVKNGEVTLGGHVSDRRMKRMAEDVIDRVPGVKDVTNQIRVTGLEHQSTGNGGARHPAQSVSNTSDKDAEPSRRPRA